MKEMIFYELKKLINLRKLLVLGTVLLLLCVGSFAIIYAMGDWKGAAEMLTYYSGSVENNSRIEEAEKRYQELYEQYIVANVEMDEVTWQEYIDLEYPKWLVRCDEVRKQNLAEMGLEAETLVVGETTFYAFMEEFIANYLPFILGFVIALLIAPVFATEYGNKMDGLLLSTKHGKKNLIIGKFIATILVILLAYIFVVGIFGVISLCVCGIGDINASFIFTSDYVFHYLFSPFNFRVWQYMLVMFTCSLLGCLGFGCLTLFVSSRCRSALSASMISLMVVYVPILAFKSIGENEGVVPNILRLFHGAVMGVRTLFSNYFPVYIGNVTLTIPAISITLLFVSSILYGIFAFRGFQKHQVQN